MDLLYAILLGAFIGWLANLIMKGKGYGLIGFIVIGIVGSMLGQWIASVLNIGASGGLGSLAISLGGALLLLFILSKLKK